MCEISPFSSHKIKYPTKQQQKDAIDIIKEICECSVQDKKTLDDIKHAAEIVKAYIDKEFGD